MLITPLPTAPLTPVVLLLVVYAMRGYSVYAADVRSVCELR